MQAPEPPVTVLGSRDPDARRAAILAAAQEVFAERGYPRATIREIASRARVTHGLVTMHFGSKENLFLKAVPGTRDLADLVAGGRSGLAARVAAGYVQRMETGGRADPFIAVVRSAAADQVTAKTLLQAMQRESLAAYESVLDEPDVSVRVDLIGAFLIGVTFNRYIVGGGPLAGLCPDALIVYLTGALEAILVGAAAPLEPQATATAAS